ncbi:MAG: hypothetical protein WAO80_07880 [Caldicoprobacterales bacterium]
MPSLIWLKKTWLMECRKAVAKAGCRGNFHRQDTSLEGVGFSNGVGLSFLQISVEASVQ